jgi:DNA-binding NtrC family response regulator
VDRLALCGRSILVIEHDRNVAFELANQLRQRGAKAFAAANLRDAQHMAEHPALAAVVTGFELAVRTPALCAVAFLISASPSCSTPASIQPERDRCGLMLRS